MTDTQEFTAPASQADLDALIAKHVGEATAKFGDYEALKEKATQFDQNQAANLSELEKATKRAEEAEKLVAGFKAAEERAGWVKEIAKDRPELASALRGSTKAELEEHYTQLTGLLGAQPASRVRTHTPPVPKSAEGGSAKGRAVEALRALKLG